ncbi:cyclic nucleotide-binding domain-containing protein [Pontibacillus sp. ALD_SL1]|nr:cyclic nucleotide-binding domain-containing protein [Pontibacillus sp. ALD_SL1]
MLTESQYDRVFTDATVNSYKKNQFIFHEDEKEEESDIYFVLNGLAKNILHRSNGKQLSIRYYYPGDLVGIMMMLTSGEMKFSVQALEETKAIRFKRERFVEIMSENQAFSNIVLEGISNLMKSLYHEVKYKTSELDDSSYDRDLFKQRVVSYSETPTTIHHTASVTEAVKKMKDEKAGGLIVCGDDQELIGVFNYQDLILAYLQEDFNGRIAEYLNEEPYAVNDQDFIYDALSYLKHNPAAIIPVLHKQQVVGLLRQTSFLKMQNSIYFDLRYQIGKANSLEELTSLSPRYNRAFQQFVAQLLDDNMFAYDICELISSYNDELHKQILHLAEEDMVEEGYGTPPINYCFIVMGSEGRKEQAFSTDQDNGMILDDYEHLENKDEIDTFFKIFTEKVNYMLETCGFPLCSGGIMAKEQKWRKSLQQWHSSIQEWLEKMDAEEIRDFTIFMDFRPIVGDFSLAYDLREFVTQKIQRSLTLQQLLMKDTLRFRVPVQPFGRIHGTGRSKVLNLKKGAIMQIVNAVRIYTIKYGIDDVNTIKRLDTLRKHERFHPRDTENAKLALHRLLSFRLKRNLQQIQLQETLNNDISVMSLSKEEKKILRESLLIAKRLQQVLELSYNRNRVV